MTGRVQAADQGARQTRYHRLLGKQKRRLNYAKGDLADYLLMLALSAGVIALCYGALSWMSLIGYVLCAFMAISFVVRHGAAFKLPLLLRQPQDIIYMLAYKLENLPWVTWAAVALAAAEYAFVSMTPQLPHQVEWTRLVGLGLFFLHFGAITAYRTVSFVDHMRKHAIVSDVLLRSPWKNVGLVRSNIRYEIIHAYLTGLLTHLVLLAPWYFALTHLLYSLLLLPVTCAVQFLLHRKWLRGINGWFYRDHWLGHNSELDFVYLHGSHHDAIPTGLIAVAGNGFLEGVLRNAVGHPTTFYNPIMACLAYSVEVRNDIAFHQFIPGIYPTLPYEFRQVGQHSTHHYGHLEPYGFAVKLDQPIEWSQGFLSLFRGFPEEFKNSATLEEELTGFKWSNSRHEWFLNVCKEHE